MSTTPHVYYALMALVWVVAGALLGLMHAMTAHSRRRGLTLLANIMPTMAVAVIALALVVCYGIWALGRMLGGAMSYRAPLPLHPYFPRLRSRYMASTLVWAAVMIAALLLDTGTRPVSTLLAASAAIFTLAYSASAVRLLMHVPSRVAVGMVALTGLVALTLIYAGPHPLHSVAFWMTVVMGTVAGAQVGYLAFVLFTWGWQR